MITDEGQKMFDQAMRDATACPAIANVDGEDFMCIAEHSESNLWHCDSDNVVQWHEHRLVTFKGLFGCQRCTLEHDHPGLAHESKDAGAIWLDNRFTSDIYAIPQAALSHPSTREAVEPTLCKHCGKEVCQIDRVGAESEHPRCRKVAALAVATKPRPKRRKKEN